MDSSQLVFDTLIIGGGAAGMMAAFSVKNHHPEYSVVILDQTHELGRKLLTSGAGRGNLTNSNLAKNPQSFFHGDPHLVESIFQQFSYMDIIRFFEDLGIPLYEEKKSGKGKIFPVIDHAKTIRNILVSALLELGVQIVCNTRVEELKKTNDGWQVKTNNKPLIARSIILACGGKTYPALGSDGSGYAIASSFGHTIIPPVVSAVPLVSKNLLSHLLQGEKCEAQVTVLINGKEMQTRAGEVLFTQYGFSGPLILDVSRDISVRINRDGKKDTGLRLSFFPNKSPEEVQSIIKDRFAKHPSYPVSHCLWGLFTEKVAGAVCAVSTIPKERKAGEMKEEEFNKLLQTLTVYSVPITDTRGWNEGEFTAGGVDMREVNPETLESKKAKGIYFAGEILDVDGPVGGFNLSWSWASGWVAGKIK
jgi:hypothetical protein